MAMTGSLIILSSENGYAFSPVSVSNGSEIFTFWSEYDGKWEDIFSIQDEIAFRVANELKTVLSPEEIRKIEKNPTESLKAYNLYLIGRYYWNKRTEEGFLTGIEYFRQAIE